MEQVLKQQAKPEKTIRARLLTSTLRRAMNSERVPINTSNYLDHKALEEIARHLFQLILAYKEKNNTVLYHSCCFCFSLRAKIPKTRHPEDQSKRACRLVTENSISTPEDLLRFFTKELARFSEHQRYLPAINIDHDPSLASEVSLFSVLE